MRGGKNSMATSPKSPLSIKASESAAPLRRAKLQFGREICGSLDIAEQREWLVTNGIGGFASGTVSGNLTRRYHGLLVAALHPPVGRTQLVAKLDETVRYAGIEYALATNRWLSGAVEPKGHLNIESFVLEGTTPIWQFALGDALVEKRIWMSQGENTTYVQYTLLRGGQSLELELKALVNYRDFHSSTHAGDWQMKVEPIEEGVQINAFDGATPFYLLSAEAEFETRHEWHRDCFLPLAKYRGLDDREDHLLAAIFSTELALSESVTLVLTTNADAQLDGSRAWEEHAEHEKKLFVKWASHDAQAASSAPDWVQQLILAADQFIVKRSLPEEADGRSIIAGYHWFGDWGRDTMIALPGLTLTTGRADVARKILLAFARYVDGGMLPNDFPDAGGRPEDNTVDNALETMAALAPAAGRSGEPFAKMAAMVKQSFGKFWNSASRCCYDVIDAPGIKNDATLRPNQIFAVSLPESPLTPEQQRAVVDVCARRLVTSHGLRSLAQEEPGYQGHYGGAPRERDGAYHQGTVWGWLMGPFVLAHLRVYQDRRAALSFLEPLGKQITSHGLGTLSEIFDGDAPFTPRGCIAQAWTVGEVLRAWRATIV